MKYGIKLTALRYIYSCDDKWYETCDYDYRPYTFEQALYVIQQLRKHFQYRVVLVSDEGEVEYEFGKKVDPYDEVEKMIHEGQPVLSAAADEEFSMGLF